MSFERGYDTPNLGTPYCPVCRPDADLTREILYPVPCTEHVRDGIERTVYQTGTLSSGGELSAGGEQNRYVCDLIHGPHRGYYLTPQTPQQAS